MEDKKRLSFGYEDIYKKIEVEIFGLVFEINKEKIENQDIRNINEDDEDVVKRKIEEIIGEGAIEKLNKKAISDGHVEMTLVEEIKVLTFLYTTYMNFTANGMINDITNTGKEIENRARNINNVNEINSKQQRNREYRNFYNRNRRYIENRNFRRY